VSLLIVTRGLPGSGKTAMARQWVAESPATRCRVNRDDFRKMFHGVRWAGIGGCEDMVTVAQFATLRALLVSPPYPDVVADDTWLRPGLFTAVRDLAAVMGAELEVWDLTDVPLEVCIERDTRRGSLVGAHVIKEMHQRYIVNGD
jgi:predicted kinase